MAGIAIAGAVALGVVLRLADPLSSPVVPAEDPYTHIALVREHIRTGNLDPLNGGESVYPPGLHAVLAATWAYTGLDLYEIVRIGPVVFGAIGILGMGLLAWRTAGPVAGVVAALAMSVAPEAIFRTTMMSPTALDLAILPFLLLALVQVLAGRLGWAGVAAPLAVFLAVSHPWLLAILCAAGLVFLATAILFPWPASRAEPLSWRGIAFCAAVLGLGLGIALIMPSFGDALGLPGSVDLLPLGLAVGALALLPAMVVALWPPRRQVLVRKKSGPVPLPLRLALSALLAAAVLAMCLLASQQGLPVLVDLPRMFGWPVLGLAIAAVVALPFIASPIANLAAGLAAATFPFVVFNPLHSEFLPHRTAIFLGFALALLAGVFAGAVATWAARALRARAAAHAASPATRAAPRASARPWLLAVGPALVVTTLLCGVVYAGTPDAYAGGWYRLYTPCEFEALHHVAAEANADPGAVIVTGDWQAKLVLAALTNDTQRVWFKPDVFTSADSRDKLVDSLQSEGRPLIVVLDRYLATGTPDADTAFVSESPWHPMGSWCANMGVAQPRMAAYATDGGAQ